nr:hypothetical protein [Tanacetum cinerariifolium]
VDLEALSPASMDTPASSSSIQIRQHNAITTARYEMSACEMDIVFALLSKLSSQDKAGTMYQIRIQELEMLTGRQWQYRQLLDSTEQLNTRIYHIEDKQKVLQVSLLASAEYLKGRGIIELEISEKMRPYLIDLKGSFTSYRLQAALSLTSKFAKRIYQFVSQWKDVGETKTYTLDEFKYMLNLKDPKGKEPEQYTQISTLQRDVLKVATALIKKGRAYHSIKFYVTAQVPQQMLIPFELPADDAKSQMARQHLDRLGIKTPDLVNKILTDSTLLSALFEFTYKLKTEKIKADKNPGGLFLKINGLR